MPTIGELKGVFNSQPQSIRPLIHSNGTRHPRYFPTIPGVSQVNESGVQGAPFQDVSTPRGKKARKSSSTSPRPGVLDYVFCTACTVISAAKPQMAGLVDAPCTSAANSVAR